MISTCCDRYLYLFWVPCFSLYPFANLRFINALFTNQTFIFMLYYRINLFKSQSDSIYSFKNNFCYKTDFKSNGYWGNTYICCSRHQSCRICSHNIFPIRSVYISNIFSTNSIFQLKGKKLHQIYVRYQSMCQCKIHIQRVLKSNLNAV